MTAMTKARCFASSLMPQFAECVGASIAGSALSALDSSRYVVFPGRKKQMSEFSGICTNLSLDKLVQPML